MKEKHYIGVDIGGTATKIGLTNHAHELLDHRSIPTDPDRGPAALIDDIASAVTRMASNTPAAIGVGCPGPLSPSRGIVFSSPNLNGWENIPLQELMQTRIGVPACIENDANVAALGQYAALPLEEKSDLVLLTLGTGIGSGTIINGQIFHGHHETGSEWGHCIVQPNGRACPCGQHGCLEQYSSATAMTIIAREEIEKGGDTSLTSGATAEMIVNAARDKDPIASSVLNSACLYLAIAIINIQHAINPKYVFLGGGVSGAGEFLLEGVVEHVRAQRWSAHDDHPIIRLAPLANTAGIVGAATLAQQHAGA